MLITVGHKYKTLAFSQNQQHLRSHSPIDNSLSSLSKNIKVKKITMSHCKFVALFVCAVLLVLCNQHTEAATARVKFSNPSYPGKCVLSSTTIMSPGQTGKAPDHPCTSVTCMENGYVEFRTCAAVAPPKGCKQRDFVNTNRNYPECCERAYDCTKHI